MANILLTDYCNLKCPYCFARTVMDGRKKHMSMKNFKKTINFLEEKKEKKVGFIGGEPTLHPEFFNLLDYALSCGFHVLLFTNGIMSKQISEELSHYKQKKLSILLNLNDRQAYSSEQMNMLSATFQFLHDMVGLGYTVYRADFNLEFHRDMILKYGLSKRIRLGLAAEIAGVTSINYFTSTDFKILGDLIVDNITQLENDDILVNFDCGFFMCLFTTMQLGIITKKSVGFVSNCRPVIDIDLNLNAHHCFALSGLYKTSIDDHQNIDDLLNHFKSKFEPLKIFGNDGNCLSCKYYHRKQCRGRCLSQILNSDESLLRKFLCVEKKTYPIGDQ